MAGSLCQPPLAGICRAYRSQRAWPPRYPRGGDRARRSRFQRAAGTVLLRPTLGRWPGGIGSHRRADHHAGLRHGRAYAARRHAGNRSGDVRGLARDHLRSHVERTASLLSESQRSRRHRRARRLGDGQFQLRSARLAFDVANGRERRCQAPDHNRAAARRCPVARTAIPRRARARMRFSEALHESPRSRCQTRHSKRPSVRSSRTREFDSQRRKAWPT